jgi:hypothetical protein
VVVFETVIVLVDVEEAVCVFVMAEDDEGADEDEADLVPNVERVEVLVEVIVFVEIAERVNRRVESEEYVDVVVFVDVLDGILESVGIALFILRCLLK